MNGPPTLPPSLGPLALRLHSHGPLVLPLPDRLHLLLPLQRPQPGAEGAGLGEVVEEL